ncbi:hypothetical protein [Streptomyces sp. TRM49041]|uniref:hypothetical protein n=1 Tax=Streptomyces sp. TRM49041 TaxID=2603216 RepID=UPI00165688CF|nr:hypothetical protein [Streptomyces sp. TRM49041]
MNATTPAGALRRTVSGPGSGARVAAALVFAGTICAQHHIPTFNRISRLDSFSTFFPNWRFFAPNPAKHDYHILYRTLNEAEETSPWRQVELIAGRKPHQIVWFPERRPEKGVFDMCSELIMQLDKGFSVLTRLPAYRMLTGFVRAEIERSGESGVKGFQITLVRASGFDESEEPDVVFVTPYTPLVPETTAGADAGADAGTDAGTETGNLTTQGADRR